MRSNLKIWRFTIFLALAIGKERFSTKSSTGHLKVETSTNYQNLKFKTRLPRRPTAFSRLLVIQHFYPPAEKQVSAHRGQAPVSMSIKPSRRHEVLEWLKPVRTAGSILRRI